MHHAGAPHRSTEVHQPVAAQDEAADVAIIAIARIFEAETAFKTQSPVLAATQAQAVGVDGLVEPLDTRCPAGIAPNLFGPFGRAAGSAPESHTQAQAHHQDQ